MPRLDEHVPIEWNHEKIFAAYDYKAERLIETMQQVGIQPPPVERARQWTRQARRYVPANWVPSVVAALMKAGRLGLRDLFISASHGVARNKKDKTDV